MKFVPTVKAIFAAILSILMSLSPLGFPRVPHARDFELVWSDEFDGDSLDAAKWEGHYCNGETASVRHGSYWHTDMAAVKDGCLHISTRYYPEGYKGNGKPGWYTCAFDTNGLYLQKYGYFEVRCILPKGSGIWSAFWMLCDGMSTVGNGGTDGAEIDIFEAPYYGTDHPRRVSSNVHYDGYGKDLRSTNVCEPYILLNDPYETFNTYGLEWNENEYIFYVNGIETGRTDFGGPSQTPEFMLLSVEVGGNGAVPGQSWGGSTLTIAEQPTDFIIDYVRAYQYKSADAHPGC